MVCNKTEGINVVWQTISSPSGKFIFIGLKTIGLAARRAQLTPMPRVIAYALDGSLEGHDNKIRFDWWPIADSGSVALHPVLYMLHHRRGTRNSK